MSRDKEYDKKYRLEHRKQIEEYKKKWEAANTETKTIYWKRYRNSHYAQQTERVKAWRLAHPEYRKEYNKTPEGKESNRKHNATRRQFGFIPLNKYFDGATPHHIDRERIIHIPIELHKSIGHSVTQNRNMDKINREAYRFLNGETL